MPPVDVLHLHHGVWLSNGAPLFAAGEEKTTSTCRPATAGSTAPSDSWIMNHMIHNLTPSRDEVYITYDIDFVPDTSPAAASIQARPDAVGRT